MAVEAAGSRIGRARRRIAGALPFLLLAGCLFDRGGIHVDAARARPARPGTRARRATRTRAPPRHAPARGHRRRRRRARRRDGRGGRDRPSDARAADRTRRPAAGPAPRPAIDRPIDLPPDRPAGPTARHAPRGDPPDQRQRPGPQRRRISPAPGARIPGRAASAAPASTATRCRSRAPATIRCSRARCFGNPLVCAVGGGALPAGRYQVNLYFAEIYWGPGCPGGGPGPGSRVFDVRIEGAVAERLRRSVPRGRLRGQPRRATAVPWSSATRRPSTTAPWTCASTPRSTTARSRPSSCCRPSEGGLRSLAGKGAADQPVHAGRPGSRGRRAGRRRR